MADQEIIVTNGYFNNLRLFGGNTTFPVAVSKRDDPPYVPSYGLKLYFEQWDEVGSAVDGNIGVYGSQHPEAIPQLAAPGRFASNPVIFSPADISGKTLLGIISDLLPSKAATIGDITDPEFQGFVPEDPGDPDDPDDDTPSYNPPDSPYLMNLTLGTTDPVGPNNPNAPNYPNTKVRFTGHEKTTYDYDANGNIIVHWTGESWMYFVGVPNPNIPTPPLPSPETPEYPSYPSRLIYQFVFTPAQNPAGTPPAYPGTDNGDNDTGNNKWITTSKLINRASTDPASPDKYLPITLSWERLAFDYVVEVREVKGVNRQVIVIKNLKRLGR